MAWDNKDVNNPELYTPRSVPSVQKANRPDGTARRRTEAETETFLFDEDETWNEPLEELPNYHSARSGARRNADTDAENPYAKRRAPVKSRSAGKRATDAIFKGRPVVYAVVIICCMAILAFIGVMMMPQMAGYFWKDLSNFAFINDE
ncbi:MAG: hypothetical protein PHY64_10905, partial [Eubacteriales bacterium]|nr:hypothetical protein [Eubacteriales bacterium]